MGNETWKGFWVKFISALAVVGVCQFVGSAVWFGRYAERISNGEKRTDQIEAKLPQYETALQRIDSEGSARYARESRETNERLRGIENLLRESRESQAAILNELKRKQ